MLHYLLHIWGRRSTGICWWPDSEGGSHLAVDCRLLQSKDSTDGWMRHCLCFVVVVNLPKCDTLGHFHGSQQTPVVWVPKCILCGGPRHLLSNPDTQGGNHAFKSFAQGWVPHGMLLIPGVQDGRRPGREERSMDGPHGRDSRRNTREAHPHSSAASRDREGSNTVSPRAVPAKPPGAICH